MTDPYCVFAIGGAAPGPQAPKPPALEPGSGRLAVGREVLDITPKDIDGVLSVIRTQLALEACSWAGVDALARSSMERTNELNASLGNAVPNLEALRCFRVRKNDASAPFYRYFQERFPQFPFVYVFVDEGGDRIFSNCELLSQKLALLRGLEEADLRGKTGKYRNFLFLAESYKASLL